MSIPQVVTRIWWAFLAVGALVVVLAVGLPALTARGADHVDGPFVGPPGGVLNTGLTTPQGADPRVDITDLYAFESPDPSKPDTVVFILAVDPLLNLVGLPPEFLPEADYEILIDTDGDAEEDISFEFEFEVPEGGVQEFEVELEGLAGGDVEVEGVTGLDVSLDGVGLVHAGVFDDPFFFDLPALLGAYAFCSAPGGPAGSTGSDFFAAVGAKVLGIVVEVPRSSLGSDTIGVWAQTSLDDQIDRMGNPGVTTLLIPNADKNAFNRGEPEDDPEDFPFIGGPDILALDTSVPSGFPNGRRLTDDVIPFDCVDAHVPAFPGTFPYLLP